MFLDDEKAPVAFDDGRDRHMRSPGFRFHGPTFYRF
jgi:hypothetical protein